MGVEFRCEHCGKVLSAEAESDASVQCPHCGQVVAVPAGLASLPRPQVASATGAGADGHGAQAQAPPAEEEAADSARGEGLIVAMGVIMPWVMSVFLHVGIFLILALITAIMTDAAVSVKPEGIIIPDAVLSEKPGGSMSPYESSEQKSIRKRITERQKRSKRDSSISDPGETRAPVELIGVGGSAGGGDDAFTLSGSGSSAGPRSTFFGHGGNAHHVVYVIDSSGSMATNFDYVRYEMLRSISMLQATQTFHIILFSGGDPVETSARRLVPATKEYKREAAEFLDGIIPASVPRLQYLTTSPVEALERAFECLRHAGKGWRGKIIYLLTDGIFPDDAKVLSAIRSWNKSKEIHINTYLYAHQQKDAVEVMKKIAAENGGRYKYVSTDE